MKKESIFNYPYFIGYLVKSLLNKYPNKQVGKTVVQKMCYLMSREGIADFDFSMYHYGPFSSEVEGELKFAKSSKIVKIRWVDDKGYFIEPGDKCNEFDNYLEEKEKKNIDKCVNKYGDFNAQELSIIATAFYSRENFDARDDELVSIVKSLKPNFKKEQIKKILQEGGVFDS